MGDLDERYDQKTWSGRFKRSFDISDPRCLAPGLFFGMSFEDARKVIQDRTEAAHPPTPDDQTWLAKKIVDARVHPDTGEIIPPPFRLSGYAVFGSITVIGMLIPNPGGNILQTAFWQTANQTHNASVNYSNRNASNPTPMSSLAMGYAAAVTSSVGLGLGLGQLIKRSAMSLAAKTTASRFIAYPAVAVSNIFNVSFMRHTELTSGIHVKDADGVVRGSSQLAAKQAIKDTAITRVILPAPLLIIPPMIMTAIGRFSTILKTSPRLALPIEAGVCFLAFVGGLPAAISMFPQESLIYVEDMEPSFANLKDKSGNPVTKFWYNKGL
eukprot:m.66546 g.66546  ORF g.66546 m.66546 type:complete len:326 (+) comp23701_c0_seq3:146-1123(+)